ncbi:Uncharacterised protein [Acinetobacter haemolyticus]|uniref:Lipoprotein n=1 Tax=Acinetobacter haemolyticus CIP 64.3 = MTCC 9819 TaxID=1217659 RepID=N9EY04_ACIHA|nr:hypothetical protein F927_03171 [Acinetobacter haemolyticus CIP 64.3 = MTCC 9819]SPT46128.1 Uncharacterised protein [Acinetobacter haemolyticus]SUU62673.1 Uncharacterised protein [Acinetobacter haemolyticus]
MKTAIHVFAIVVCMSMLQGCIHKVVTVPVKVAYKTTKGVVKGTAAVWVPSFPMVMMRIKRTIKRRISIVL